MSFMQLQYFLNKFSYQREFSLPTVVCKVTGHCRQDTYVCVCVCVCVCVYIYIGKVSTFLFTFNTQYYLKM